MSHFNSRQNEDTTSTLRDLAYVFHLTAQVKQCLLASSVGQVKRGRLAEDRTEALSCDCHKQTRRDSRRTADSCCR